MTPNAITVRNILAASTTDASGESDATLPVNTLITVVDGPDDYGFYVGEVVVNGKTIQFPCRWTEDFLTLGRNVVLTVEVTDESGDSDLALPVGLEVTLRTFEGDHYIAETLDGDASFPLMLTDFAELTPARRIVNAIRGDLADRSGMGFDGIDAATVAEIEAEWERIINEIITK